MEDNETVLGEILEIIGKVKPHWQISRGLVEGGHGFVADSIFAFGERKYYWIVYLCENETYAYEEISPEWLKFYSNLILSSPGVFVFFNFKHQITAWFASQDKTCPVTGPAPMVRAV